jgi:phosphoglycolate phosphatase
MMIKAADIDAFVFDLDGTLVDSAEDLRAALNVLMSELGLRSIEPSEVKGMIGDGVLKLVERGLEAANGDAARKDALLPRFMEIYQEGAAASTVAYPEVVETLTELRRRDFKMALVTNKPVAATRKILEALSLAPFFPVVIGGDTLPFRKPHPAPLLEAIRQLGVKPARAVMVGDNIHDIEAAHAAGMSSVVVSYGYHHGPPSEFNANYLVDSFGELLSLPIARPDHA